jgi:4-amino-4-deoxy-L-arabinose transferase-like glycosyltransferase
MRSSRVYFVLAAVGLILFIPALFFRDLWKPDEPRYAQASREMVETGEWIVPHLNGKTYAHKPPLVFWMAAGLREIGVGPNGGRLVSMLAGIATMLLVASLGMRWFSALTGLLAGLILATSFEYAWMARNGGLDVPLTFLTTLGVWAYVRGGRLLFLLYVAASLSVLVKGPVGILFVLLGVVALRVAKVPVDTKGWRHVLWGVPLMLLVIAAWVAPACIRGGEAYTQELLFKQNVGRAVQSWSHKRPFFYYVAHMPEMFAPWIVIAIPAAMRGWQRRRKDRAILAMLLWFAAGLLIFSAISGKRVRYLLPIYPAFALITARGIEAGYLAVLDKSKAIWMRRAALVQHGLAVLLAGAMAVLALFGGAMLGSFEEKNPIVVRELAWVWDGAWHWFVLLATLCLIGLAIAGIRATLADNARRSCALLLATALLGWMAADALVLPVLNPLKSSRAITRRLDALFPPGGDAELRAAWHFHHGAYSIYSDRLVLPVERQPEDAARFLREGPRRAILVSRKELERRKSRETGATLQSLLSPDWSISELGRVGSNVMLVVSNFELEE